MPTNRRDLIKLAAAGFAGAATAPAARAHPDGAPAVQFFRSDKLLSPSMKVVYPKLDKGRSYHLLHKVKLPELRIGDILTATAEAEITGEHPYAIGIASFVALADFRDDPDQAYARGRHICHPAGSNLIDKEHHHLMVTRAGSIEVTKQMAGLNAVFFIGYAASDARKVGDKVTVMDSYGHLSVVLHAKPG